MSSPENIPLLLKNVTNEGHTDLRERVRQLELRTELLQRRELRKKKRIRRRACEVARKFECEACAKKYASPVALNLHKRQKHAQVAAVAGEELRPNGDRQ